MSQGDGVRKKTSQALEQANGPMAKKRLRNGKRPASHALPPHHPSKTTAPLAMKVRRN